MAVSRDKTGSRGASSSAAKSVRPPRGEAEQLPGPEEAAAAFASALTPEMERPRSFLGALRNSPPQLIHLEGGETDQRVALALWWAAMLNCENRNEEQGGDPCLVCPTCLRTGVDMNPDVLRLDGRAGAIRIDDVRALRPLLGEPPRFGRMRVVVMLEAQALGVEAANSLLKSLEDPCPGTCFLFTAPQRERLLPTLVSRGWVVTLPWPDPSRPLVGEARDWALALAEFADSGQGWFAKTSVKGSLDAALAQEVVLAGQKALADSLAGRPGSPLARVLSSLSEELLPAADELFSRCQEALQAQVNPALVLDHMATRLHLLVHGR